MMKYGQKIKITEKYVRECHGDLKKWVLTPFKAEGLFLGMRTIKNGTVCSSYEGATFTPTEHFRVALVSPGERLNPVYAPMPEKA